MESRKNCNPRIFIRMNTQTKFVVTYQKAFGFSVREEKEFDILEDAQWFSRAMKRAKFITNILEVKS